MIKQEYINTEKLEIKLEEAIKTVNEWHKGDKNE